MNAEFAKEEMVAAPEVKAFQPDNKEEETASEVEAAIKPELPKEERKHEKREDRREDKRMERREERKPFKPEVMENNANVADETDDAPVQEDRKVDFNIDLDGVILGEGVLEIIQKAMVSCVLPITTTFLLRMMCMCLRLRLN